MLLAVVVDRHVGRVGPVGELSAHVFDEGSRRPPIGLFLEGRQVGERLDGRAGLPLAQRHIHLPVNIGVVEVHAAQHGQDLAGLRLQGDQRRVADVTSLQAVNLLPRHTLRQFLQVRVERGVDAQAALVHHLRTELGLQ